MSTNPSDNTDEHQGISLDWDIIPNIHEYIDCDIHARLPTKGEYLIRIYLDRKTNQISEPAYRYAAHTEEEFSKEEVTPSSKVEKAINSILPKVHALIRATAQQQTNLHPEAQNLKDKDFGSEHPDHTENDWREEVKNCKTKSGYWDWLSDILCRQDGTKEIALEGLETTREMTHPKSNLQQVWATTSPLQRKTR